MSFDDNIKAYFVNESEDASPSDDISTAYSYLKDHINKEYIRYIKPEEGFDLINSKQLTKKDVFVFEKFDGDLFKELQKTKCLIIGPRCLLSCLLRCEEIPLGTNPVFTTAMRNLHITASGITSEEKAKVRILISWMGGYYFQNSGSSITHLISNTIKSAKYEVATLNGIPVMHIDWVHRVWERSSVEDIRATDPEFDKYKLPIFFGANITCSGVDTDKKNEILRLVNENGGTYNRSFRSQYTDIVIIEKNKINFSDKYKAAVRCKKEVLLPEWIFDSIKKGYALPTKAYQISSIKVSTPNKIDQSFPDFQMGNSTHLSEISKISLTSGKASNITVNDSVNSSSHQALISAQISKPMQKELQSKSIVNYKLILDGISPRKSKNSGNFLDGCSIYLSGFLKEEKEKLHRILNAGGATRYDFVNDKVSHIIVGNLNESDLDTWKREGFLSVMSIVRVEWLQESIKLKQPASEVEFCYPLPETCEVSAPSPASERTLRSMSQSSKHSNVHVRKQLFENAPNAADETIQNNDSGKSVRSINSPRKSNLLESDEMNLLAQYSQESEILPPVPNQLLKPNAQSTANASSISNFGTNAVAAQHPTESSAAFSTMEYGNLDFLQGMVVFIDEKHFDEEFYSQMIGECEAAQGNVVQKSFRDEVDYAIVSFEKTFNKNLLPVKAKHIITELYIEDCMRQNKLVSIEYYHKYIPQTADIHPLKDMTIVISLYLGLERDFIDSIAKLLGATVNQTLVKKERPLLICQSPEGSKYQGAIKWNYPVVNSEWLLDCASSGSKLPYNKYLVGDSPIDFPSATVLRKRNSDGSFQMEPPKPNNEEMEDAPVPMETDAEPTNAATMKASLCYNNVSCFTPLRNKRVSELAGIQRATRSSANSSEPDSPFTPPNIGKPSINFKLVDDILEGIEEENVRECLRECIEEMRNNQTPELERIRRQAFTPNNRKIPTPKGIPDFCTTPAYEKRMLEQFDRRWRLPISKLKPSTPIEEIRKRVVRATCKMNGVEYSGDEETPLQNKPSGRAIASGNVMARSTFENKLNACNKNNASPQSDASSVSQQKSNFDKISFEDSSPEIKQINDFLKNYELRRLNKVSNACRKESEESEAVPAEPYQSEGFGGYTDGIVGWRDPTDFSTTRRFHTTTMRHEGTPCFSLSCSDESKRDDVVAKINELHGKVSENLNSFDPKSTHFLIERLNRGEKILGSISSGKWVLSLNYIEECYAKNVFIDEELFEWGNPKAYNLPTLSQEEQVIAKAAHRWRKLLAESLEKNLGAFTNFRAILKIPERNLESLKNVIKAGNGEVISAKSPYSKCDEVLRATHCFVDMRKTPITNTDYKFLSDNGVIVLSQMYINAYLMNVKDVDVTKFKINMKIDS